MHHNWTLGPHHHDEVFHTVYDAQDLGYGVRKEHKFLRPCLNLLKIKLHKVVLKQQHKTSLGDLWCHPYIFHDNNGSWGLYHGRGRKKRALCPIKIFLI